MPCQMTGLPQSMYPALPITVKDAKQTCRLEHTGEKALVPQVKTFLP